MTTKTLNKSRPYKARKILNRENRWKIRGLFQSTGTYGPQTRQTFGGNWQVVNNILVNKNFEKLLPFPHKRSFASTEIKFSHGKQKSIIMSSVHRLIGPTKSSKIFHLQIQWSSPKNIKHCRSVMFIDYVIKICLNDKKKVTSNKYKLLTNLKRIYQQISQIINEFLLKRKRSQRHFRK